MREKRKWATCACVCVRVRVCEMESERECLWVCVIVSAHVWRSYSERESERERGNFVRSKERVGHVSVCMCKLFPPPLPFVCAMLFQRFPHLRVAFYTRESLSPRADLVKQRTKDGPNPKQWNVIIWISLEFYLFLPYIRCGSEKKITWNTNQLIKTTAFLWVN